jgi:hypothetical protein
MLNGLSSNGTLTERCEECHGTIPSAFSDAGHANGTVNLNWGTLANQLFPSETPTFSGGVCSNVYCHDPAGTGGTLAAGNVGTDVTPDWDGSPYNVGDPPNKNQTTCELCHLVPNGSRTLSGIYDHSSLDVDSDGCSACHNHEGDSTGGLHMNGVLFGQAGDSSGNAACSGCHTDLYNANQAVASMHGNVGNINYKHFMNNTDVTGTFFGGTSKYPDTYPDDASPQLDTKRRCLMCHVDHDIFRNDLNTNSIGRADNLRESIHVEPTTSSGFQNTDFDPTTNEGGICLSCHHEARTKSMTTPNDATMTPPVPFAGLNTTEARDIFKMSTHVFSVDSALYLGPDSGASTGNITSITTDKLIDSGADFVTDGVVTGVGVENVTDGTTAIVTNVDNLTTLTLDTDIFPTNDGDAYKVYTSKASRFKAVCLKCHNDTIGTNYGPKTGVQGQDSLNTGEPAFARHISSNDSSLAVMSTKFEQNTATGGTSGTPSTLVRTGAGWVVDEWLGRDVIITGGTGQHQRATVLSNTTDTLNLPDGSLTVAPDNTSKYDIVKSPLPAQDLCFSCHTTVADGGKAQDDLDWYGQQPMKAILQKMKGLFIGDMGWNQAGASKNDITIDLCTPKTSAVAADFFANYQYKSGTYATVLTANTQPSDADPLCTAYPSAPNLMTITVPSVSGNGLVNAGVTYELFKPAFHPLDTFGRHRPYERVTAPGAGGIVGSSITEVWNMGDEGKATADGTTTTLTDDTKSWTASQWLIGGGAGENMYIFMKFGANNGLNRMITANGANTLTFNAFPNAILGGDTYYIGNVNNVSRHVICVDCHNVHASTHNPEDGIDATDATNSGATWVQDVTAINANWPDDNWKGHLIKVRKSPSHGTYPDLEQIRFVTGYTAATGRFDVSAPWTSNPENGDSFELLMGDKWDATTGQDGGRAGSGSTGVWGVTPSGWTDTGATPGTWQDTSALTQHRPEGPLHALPQLLLLQDGQAQYTFRLS